MVGDVIDVPGVTKRDKCGGDGKREKVDELLRIGERQSRKKFNY